MEIMMLPLRLAREYTPIQTQSSEELHQEESIFDKYKAGLVHTNAPFKLFQTNCSTSGDDDSDDDSKGDRRARGPYRKYTFQEKMQAVDRIVSGEDVKIISKQFGIPRRNLLRWKKNGCQRKEGGGRPTDAQMERNIYQKIMSKQLQTQKQIRKYAIDLSKTSSFKASKGWFVKFCNRFDIILKNSNGTQVKLDSEFENENNENCQSVQLKLQI